MNLVSLRPLWIAIWLMSRFPVRFPGAVEPVEVGRSALWYPFVGLLIGLSVGLTAAVLAGMGTDPDLAATVALAVWVWFSGAIFLDGLADTTDAWVGGIGSGERTLEIMKNPGSSPVAVTALVLLLITKWAGLEALIAAGSSWLIVAIPMLGRAQLLLLLLTTPYAREQGMAANQSRELPRRAARNVVIFATGGALLLMGSCGLAMVLAAALLLVAGRRAMLQRIAGFTGDTSGALTELTETAMLLICVMLLRP